MAVRILSIEPGSLAERLPLLAGDSLVSINGTRLQDVLDLKYHLAGDEVVLKVQREEETFEFDLGFVDEPLGVDVEPIRTKVCGNDCLFCFIDQLPDGTRPTLQIRDDDFRLSFLHGNYVTLTNMTEREIDRVIEQHLSPLFVSVHSTDMQVRTFLLGRRKEAVFWPKFERLIAGGIQLNCQIVLCPAINDGPVLKQTIYDLLAHHPGANSIAIVPLGLSDHPAEKMKALTAVTDQFCAEVIGQVDQYQRDIRTRIGKSFAYLADEFYLRAGKAVPALAHYDGFPQLEDGIGMVRLFLKDFENGLRRLRLRPAAFLRGQRATVATGALFAPVLRSAIERFNHATGASWQVLEVPSWFLGTGITVAGLMAGCDIIRAAADRDLGQFLLVPSESLANERRLFLDDLNVEQLSVRLSLPVFAGGESGKDLFELLPQLADPAAVRSGAVTIEV